jgi:hypothetical protein
VITEGRLLIPLSVWLYTQSGGCWEARERRTIGEEDPVPVPDDVTGGASTTAPDQRAATLDVSVQSTSAPAVGPDPEPQRPRGRVILIGFGVVAVALLLVVAVVLLLVAVVALSTARWDDGWNGVVVAVGPQFNVLNVLTSIIGALSSSLIPPLSFLVQCGGKSSAGTDCQDDVEATNALSDALDRLSGVLERMEAPGPGHHRAPASVTQPTAGLSAVQNSSIDHAHGNGQAVLRTCLCRLRRVSVVGQVPGAFWVAVFVVNITTLFGSLLLADADGPGTSKLRMLLIAVPVLSGLATLCWTVTSPRVVPRQFPRLVMAVRILTVVVLACTSILVFMSVPRGSRQALLDALADDVPQRTGQPPLPGPSPRKRPVAPIPSTTGVRGVVVLDASWSTGRDVGQRRTALQVMKQALLGVNQSLGATDAVTLVVASSGQSAGRTYASPRVASTATGPSEGFTKAVAGTVDNGRTGLHEALEMAQRQAWALETSGRPAPIVILTDGIGLNDKVTGETPTDVRGWGGPTRAVVVGAAARTTSAGTRCDEVKRVVRGVRCGNEPLSPLVVQERLRVLLTADAESARTS